MNQQISNRAIKAALNGNWSEAIEYNLQTLLVSPNDIQALNRLAKAYVSIGQTKNAKKTWNRVLRLDRYNPIATQQLEKLKTKTPSAQAQIKQAPRTDATTFLDDPGKTKTTQLVKLANSKLLLSLEPGQTVVLLPKQRFIKVTTETNQHLGNLPDDLAINLLKLMKAGNKYKTIIRRVGKNSLHVFIKEVKRVKRLQNFPSFPIGKSSVAVNVNPSSSITKMPIDVTPTGEEEAYK